MIKIFYILVFFVNTFAIDLNNAKKLSKDQVLNYNIGRSPLSLDPQLVLSFSGWKVATNLFETLLEIDENRYVSPAAAQSYEHSDDFKTWTFYIRKDAKWSNGDPLTAQDFVYAFQRLADPKTASPNAFYLENLRIENSKKIIKGMLPPKSLGVFAIDKKTLQLKLDKPLAFADLMMVIWAFAPLPQKVIEKYGDDWTKPNNIVTNGAWTLDKNIINEKIVLKRNPYYWDNKNIILDKVVLYEIPGLLPSLLRYRGGDIDVSNYPSELFEKVRREFPKELYKKAPELCTYFLRFNLKKSPFNNSNIRRALNLVIERENITDKILKTGSESAYNLSPKIIASGQDIKEPFWISWSLKKRIQEAKKLLIKEGYSKKNPLKITYLYNTSEDHKLIAVAVASMWKHNLSGLVDVKLDNREFKTFLSLKKDLKFDIARDSWCADYNDASSFLNLFKSDNPYNDSGYSDKEYDDLLDKAYESEDIKSDLSLSRSEIYGELEKKLDKDSILIPLYYYAGRPLIKPYVKNYEPSKNARHYFKYVYILDKKNYE